MGQNSSRIYRIGDTFSEGRIAVPVQMSSDYQPFGRSA